MEKNIFDTLNEAIIASLSQFVNTYAGLMQVMNYLAIGVFFFYALMKCWQAQRHLAHIDLRQLGDGAEDFDQIDSRSSLAMVAASFFCKTKNTIFKNGMMIVDRRRALLMATSGTRLSSSVSAIFRNNFSSRFP